MKSSSTNSEKLLMLYFKAKEKELSNQFKIEIQELKKEILNIVGINKEYLTKNEVCKTYKISPSTLERYIKDGLPVFSTGVGCSRKFIKEDVENYIKLRGKLNKMLYGKNR